MGVIVTLPDGRPYTINTLLGNGDSNVKLTKSDKAGKGYLTVGLSLSPAKESGYEMCASRSPGCTRACIFTSGMGQIHSVEDARIAKTIFFMEQRSLFKTMLFDELASYNRRAKRKGKTLACRPNVFSDVMWEKIFPDMFTEFADVQFYDYTKHFNRAVTYSQSRHQHNRGLFPQNYHLTFSRSETNDNDVEELVRAGTDINIAVVFDSKDYPKKYLCRPVINGDETDLRFLDSLQSIVGLYAKGKGKKDTSGFIIQTLSLIKR